MRAGLPKKEPEIIKRWDEANLFETLREQSKGRDKYILHDGPPYANGNLHIGHALNKILKDAITRSLQMSGYDSNYVPGWDCHGLPIEWKIEEQYRAKGKNKDEVPINEFRKECRDFAAHWVDVQTQEFRRLGVEGNFKDPYLTMTFDAEATIAAELLKFAENGMLYRGSKPVMWSVVEKTALAEAEIEYQEHQSDMVWVPFPLEKGPDDLLDSHVVIWTTTPWTIPSNRAVCYSNQIQYGLYEVAEAQNDFGPQPGQKYIFAKRLAEDCAAKAKLTLTLLREVTTDDLQSIVLRHPLHDAQLGGYEFRVPMLDGEHVTDDAGTGFVHTAPSHGRDDFEIWMARKAQIEALGVDSTIPFTVDGDGFYTNAVPGFGGARVFDDKGKKGDANGRVIEALIKSGRLFARGRLKHEYPHSWRSKKPVIFRNTPQWFVSMDKGYDANSGDTLRARVLRAISQTRFVPSSGQTRLDGMIQNRPDWVLSRQRAWGVPIVVFVHKETGELLSDSSVNERIISAFHSEGADAWFAEGAKERFLGNAYKADEWEKIDDILDVWFDSGSTHAFVLEGREELTPKRQHQGGNDKVIYLEGTDQHRGWFHSSILESCGTRGVAPYDVVITHGFTMDEQGRKMSKSLGNSVAPQEVIKQYGADILRLWVMSCDYADDQRIGNEIIKSNVDAYRKIRNTIRWMLGTLAHDEGEVIEFSELPELERLILHRLKELDELVRQAYLDFDFKRIFSTLFNFMTVELSAFYFDVRKDALYCEPISSVKRKAALQTVATLFDCLIKWLAPMVPFTAEESWMSRHGDEASSVHLTSFPDLPETWLDQKLAARYKKIRQVRKVVTGALEIERREKRIGSSLEAAPEVFISEPDLFAAVSEIDFAELCITSDISISQEAAPGEAFQLDDVKGVAVIPTLATGKKCARSWRISNDVGSDPDYPDISTRDAVAMKEWVLRQEKSPNS